MKLYKRIIPVFVGVFFGFGTLVAPAVLYAKGGSNSKGQGKPGKQIERKPEEKGVKPIKELKASHANEDSAGAKEKKAKADYEAHSNAGGNQGSNQGANGADNADNNKEKKQKAQEKRNSYEKKRREKSKVSGDAYRRYSTEETGTAR